MPPRARAAEPERVASSSWGLGFESVGEEQAAQLESQFNAERQANQISADRLLSVGSAALHLLLALKLRGHGEQGLAALALATTAQQLATAALAWRWPDLFQRLRPLAYLLGLTWPMAQSTLLAGRLQPTSCGRPGRGLFWISQLLASGVPWLAVHALVFPMPLTCGCLMSFIALLVAMAGNRTRCRSVLEQCPAAGPHFTEAARKLGSLTSLFSAVRVSVAGVDGVNGSAALLPPASSGGASALQSCVSLYGAAQLGLGYGGALHLAWGMERLARLAFIRRTNNVEAEWHLERKERSPYMLALELMLGLAVAWQLMELWQMLGPRL